MRATKPQIIICMISICIFLYHMGSWKCNVFITFKHEVTQFIHFTLKRSIYSRKCLLLFSNFSRICPSFPIQGIFTSNRKTSAVNRWYLWTKFLNQLQLVEWFHCEQSNELSWSSVNLRMLLVGGSEIFYKSKRRICIVFSRQPIVYNSTA